VIKEYTETDIFFNLPHDQFGFVYAFHYFEYKPLEIITQYLDEIFLLLRPGGTFLFSFNDCDQWKSVGSVEHFSSCYTPGRLIRKHIQSMDYQIVSDHCDQSGLAWLELRRPGELDSIRGGQVVSGIFRKPKTIEQNIEQEIIDKSVQDIYNELDLDGLIELAGILNVDISDDKTKREYNIKKVRRSISAYLERMNYPEETLRRLFKPKETK
jgi:SAM-dependent methyltransferase